MTKKFSARFTRVIQYSLVLMVLSMALVLTPVTVNGTASYLNQADAASWWETANQGGLNVVGEAYGQSGVDSESNDIRVVVARIIRRILEFLGLIFLIIIIAAGFRWMTAGGDEDKVSTARKQITNGVIGLAIIFAAWAIDIYITNQIIYALTGVMPITWSW